MYLLIDNIYYAVPTFYVRGTAAFTGNVILYIFSACIVFFFHKFFSKYFVKYYSFYQ